MKLLKPKECEKLLEDGNGSLHEQLSDSLGCEVFVLMTGEVMVKDEEGCALHEGLGVLRGLLSSVEQVDDFSYGVASLAELPIRIEKAINHLDSLVEEAELRTMDRIDSINVLLKMIENGEIATQNRHSETLINIGLFIGDTIRERVGGKWVDYNAHVPKSASEFWVSTGDIRDINPLLELWDFLYEQEEKQYTAWFISPYLE